MGKAFNYLEQGVRLLFHRRAELPSFIILFVTSKCNSKCNHCFYWKDINAHKNELTFEEIKKLSSDLGRISNLALSGGEPVLREDLPEICELFYKNNKPDFIHVPTNGLSPSKVRQSVTSILEKCKCTVSVAISLDGLEETHDKIRGVKGNWRSVFETYEALVPLKGKYDNLRILVNTVISNKNCKEFRMLADIIKEKMPKIDGHGFDWVRGAPKSSELGLPSLDEIRGLMPSLKEIRRHYLRNRITLRNKFELSIRNYISDLNYETLKTKSQVIPCRAGDMFAVVYPHGGVALCELLPEIGNLREQDIKAIWNSQRAEDQRRYIKSKKCWCTHGCFQPSNVILCPRTYSKILKNFIRG